MFHSRKQNQHINRIHERASRVVCKVHSSPFDEFLAKDNSCKIYDRSLQKLVTEIFKIKMNLAPEIIEAVFEIVEKSRKIHSVRYGIETASFDSVRV